MAPTFSSMATTPKLPLFSPKITKLPSRPRPTTVNLVTCGTQRLHWVSVDRDVRTHILKSLPTDIHPEVAAPMRHLISSAPPTAAPAICLASCQLICGHRSRGMSAASCAQLMHVALHAHGRLVDPARSAPQGNFPAGIELMTGDGVLTLGYEIMSRSEGVGPERVVRAVIEMASGVGPGGVLEVEAGGGTRREREGRLSACASACGAIMGGGSEEEVERMRRVGFYAGMMCAGSDEDDGNAFLELARLELKGFGEERLSVMGGLMDTLMGQRST